MTPEKTRRRILIVDDEQIYLDKFGSWAREFGYEVTTASSVTEGLSRLEGIEAIVTDFSIGRKTGNDLARQVKKLKKIPVAGITGGLPRGFDKSVIDITESKIISKEMFGDMLESLFESSPAQAYAQKVKMRVTPEIISATSILLQGYYFLKAFHSNLPEVVVDGRTIISKEDMSFLKREINKVGKPEEIFEMFEKGELNVREVYESACRRNPPLREDKRLQGVIECIANRDYTFSIADAVYVSEVIIGERT